MSNPPLTDRRFNKPTLESLVDLINFSNKSYIRYGEIEVVQVAPIPNSGSALYNTVVTIRLAGSGDGAPTIPMTYARLSLGDYIPDPVVFRYDGVDDAATLFDQLRELHHIWLSGEDCVVVIGEVQSDGLRPIRFIPKSNHIVWTGELLVWGGPSDHLATAITETDLSGFTLEQLMA